MHKFTIRHSKGGCYTVRLYTFLMFVHRYFFEECSDFDFILFVVVVVGKFTASWRSRSKYFLNPRVVNLSVCLFNTLFGNNFRKNKKMSRKFWNVFELHMFALHMKNCYCIAQTFLQGTLKISIH